MVQFLKEYKAGVNVVALVLNGQSPRVTTGTARLVRLLDVFFNNSQFWHQVCIVFTRCFAGVKVNKDLKRTKYRDIIRELAVKCGGQTLGNIPLPVYFVDSPAWETDWETAQELAALHAFVVQCPPLPTEYLVVPNPHWYKIETQTKEEPLKSERIETVGDGAVRIVTFQVQEREWRTAYDGTRTCTEWKTTKEWEERESLTCVPETVRAVTATHTTDVFEERKGEPVFFGLFGPQPTYQECVGSNVRTHFERRHRTKTTGFDGKTVQGEWVVDEEGDDEAFVPARQRARANHAGASGPVPPEAIEIPALRYSPPSGMN
jgi:hypothetical protein